MVTYNKQDLINFPINTYVEIVDWEDEVYDLGVVVNLAEYKEELYFGVKDTSGNICSFHPSRLRRISNV